MKKYLFSIVAWLLAFSTSFAQSNSGVDMATGLRSSGKIWVVVLVLLTIVVGLFIYLFTIDRRVKKLEENK